MRPNLQSVKQEKHKKDKTRNALGLFRSWTEKGAKTATAIGSKEKEIEKQEGQERTRIDQKTKILRRIGRASLNYVFRVLGRKWVAGSTAEKALEYVHELNNANFSSSAIINHLGEHEYESRRALDVVREYKKIVDLIKKQQADASLSIKPSQFGFDVDDNDNPGEFCFKNMEEIVKYAHAKGIFVWFDMENSRYTDFTIETYEKLVLKYSNIGICLQANLKRTQDDLERLIKLSERDLPVRVRLVKGIYENESADIAFTNDELIHMNFANLIETAFKTSPKNFGVAIGSHHIKRIEEAVALLDKHPKDFFQIQILKGVRPELRKYRARNRDIVEYVPYGKEPFPYCARRIKESPTFVRKNLPWYIRLRPVRSLIIYLYDRLYEPAPKVTSRAA